MDAVGDDGRVRRRRWTDRDSRAQLKEGEVLAVGPGRRAANGELVPMGAWSEREDDERDDHRRRAPREIRRFLFENVY